MSRRSPAEPDTDLEALLAQSEAICSRSESVLGWAKGARPDQPPAPLKSIAPSTPARRPKPRKRIVEVRHEAELAPTVTAYLEKKGLTVARELCLYPTRRSRRRTVADLAGLQPDTDAVARRMKVEGRRVTVAEFWPALLQTLHHAPEVPFRRRDLLELLADDPLGQAISPQRLSRYIRTLRRYGYLRRLSATTYTRRSRYIPVAAQDSLVAVELKRHSFRAALAQARSYARVVDQVWVATAGRWKAKGALARAYSQWGIGALEVHGNRIRQVLAPSPGKGRDPACAPYGRIVAERLVRERILGRPRAFGQ